MPTFQEEVVRLGRELKELKSSRDRLAHSLSRANEEADESQEVFEELQRENASLLDRLMEQESIEEVLRILLPMRVHLGGLEDFMLSSELKSAGYVPELECMQGLFV